MNFSITQLLVFCNNRVARAWLYGQVLLPGHRSGSPKYTDYLGPGNPRTLVCAMACSNCTCGNYAAQHMDPVFTYGVMKKILGAHWLAVV